MFRLRCFGLAVCLGLAAASGLAQSLAHDWAVGAAWGGVNDVGRTFQFTGFAPREISAWADYRLEPNTLLRASYLNIRTTYDNTDAVTMGISYTFFEGFYTSGLFGGIGGYRVRPETVLPETAFGFHVGVDGDFRIAKPVSLIIRLTYHGILSSAKRSLLVAAAGIAIHP